MSTTAPHTLDLTHTRAAVARYDAHVEAEPAEMSDAQSDAFHARKTVLAWEVGQAFADDTADRNPRDSAALVRPTDPWLRRLLAAGSSHA